MFIFNGNPLEIVDKYKCLGIDFNNTHIGNM